MKDINWGNNKSYELKFVIENNNYDKVRVQNAAEHQN